VTFQFVLVHILVLKRCCLGLIEYLVFDISCLLDFCFCCLSDYCLLFVGNGLLEEKKGGREMGGWLYTLL